MLLSLCPLWSAEIAEEQIEYFDGSTLIAGAFLPPVSRTELRGEGEASYLGKNKALEATLVAGWERLATEIDVSGYRLTKTDLEYYYINILSNHGEIFHVDPTMWGMASSGQYITKVRPTYTVTDAAALAEMKAELEQAVQNALSLVSDNMSDLEKALVLHDFVCSNCEYDHTASLSHIRDAYGALVLKHAVCAGYAISYAHLLRQVGVHVDYIDSQSMNHAWNAVFIDGEWYHVDVTWDDGYDIPEQFLHEYFLKSDTAIKNLEHPVWDYPLYTCTSTRFDDYFWTKEDSFASGAVPCFAGCGYIASSISNELYAYDLETGQGEKVLELPDVRWKNWVTGGLFKKKYYQLASFHGLLAINTPDAVLLCDPDTMTTATLPADLPVDTGYCYGLWMSDGNSLYAVIRQKPNGDEYTMESLPWVPVAQVTVEPAAQEYNVLNAGGTESLQLSATVSPANASWQVLTWSSDNENVATVDSQGQASISLAAPGAATIYATSRENISGQCNISVDYPPIVISVAAFPEAGGQVSGGGTFDHGVMTTLTAFPADDYIFAGWFRNDELISNEESYQITVYEDADYIAVFAPKTYAVTTDGCSANKETASRGETVTVTATLPEGALATDYEFAWSSVPGVEFTVSENTATFEMPAEAISVSCVTTLKTYMVTVDGCTADKDSASRGETVTVTATLPEGALATDYEFAWSSVPGMEFTVSETTASFEMPAEPIQVTCTATLRSYAVTTDGCTADKDSASRGETVTVTATLPAEALTSDYDYEWTFVPEVGFAAGEGVASFEMPAEPVTVTCVATLRTYSVTTIGCTADKETASRGEMVIATATLPEGTSATDYDLSWNGVPEVDFIEIDSVTVSFAMPASEITVTCEGTLNLYPITVVGATSKKPRAATGETVVVTAMLPEGAITSDYDFEWTFAPEVEFTAGEGTASFEMPDVAIVVTCVTTLKTYAVTVDGCTADKASAARGETITVTATFPEDEEAEFWDFTWSSVPPVEFTAIDELTMNFEMPAEAVTVICAMNEKPMENTTMQRVLQLVHGWNPVVLSLVPDTNSIERLKKIQPMVLDSQSYRQAHEFSANNLYWLYAPKDMRIVLTGEPFVTPMPQDSGWQTFGAFDFEFSLEDYEIWQWNGGVFQKLDDPQIVPGKGYFLRKRQ